MGLARSILLNIMPDTPTGECIRRLAFSSHLLFIKRAYDGLLKIGSYDLTSVFNEVLSGKGARHLELLVSLINEVRNMNPEKASVDVIANKAKILFSLYMAIKARIIMEAGFDSSGEVSSSDSAG